MNITKKLRTLVLGLLLGAGVAAVAQNTMKIELSNGNIFSFQIDDISRVYFPEDVTQPDDTIVNPGITPEQAQEYLAAIYADMASDYMEGYSDMGTTQYTRALFMLTEFPTDECFWVYDDSGIRPLETLTLTPSNECVPTVFARLYHNIAMCNTLLRSLAHMSDVSYMTACLEARTLRAFSYYWLVDLFGNVGIVTENSEVGVAPHQSPRAEVYAWLANELEDIVSHYKDFGSTPAYGHVGLDGAQGLLARLYLNAEVYSGQAQWNRCKDHCAQIISRHKGTGYQNSGLANIYYYLFCRDNHQYMPGGSNPAENEILFGLAYDENNENYGGPTFLTASVLQSGINSGIMSAWACMVARQQFSSLFENNDRRNALWLKESDGHVIDIAWRDFYKGYAPIKFTNLVPGNNNGDNYYTPSWNYDAPETVFAYCDIPLIRLADVYLMYAECNLRLGDVVGATETVNLIRSRAGLQPLGAFALTLDEVLAERGRELYQEMVRRTDLIRFGKFTGDAYNWAWKGNMSTGRAVPECLNLMPIPANELTLNPDWVQNPGFDTPEYEEYASYQEPQDPEPEIKPGEPAPLYVRGGMNGWDVNEAYRFYYTDIKDVWRTNQITIPANVEFKLADSSWGTYNYGYNGFVFPNEPVVLEYSGYNITSATDFYGYVEARIGSDYIVMTLVPTEDVPPVTFEGEGTLDNPYTVNDALYIINNNLYTSEKVYVKGTVSNVSIIDTTYGNANYYISDGATSNDELYVYRGLNLDGAKFTSDDDLKPGDKVVIYGELTLYNGRTPEFCQGSYITSITFDRPTISDDPTLGTLENPLTCENVIALNPLSTTDAVAVDVWVRGYIVGYFYDYEPHFEISDAIATNILISDNPSASSASECVCVQLPIGTIRSALNLKDNPQNLGLQVTVKGDIMKYNSMPGVKNTSEYSFEGQTTPGITVEEGNGTVDNPYSAAQAYNLVLSGNYTTDDVYVKGYVTDITNIDTGDYGNATYYLSSDGSDYRKIQVYRGFSFNGEKFTDANQIKVGDLLVVYGHLDIYNGNPEVGLGSSIVSINGKGVDEYKPTTPIEIYKGLVDNSDDWTITVDYGPEIVWSWKIYGVSAYLNGSAYVNGTPTSSKAYAYTNVDLSRYTTAVVAFEHAAKFQTTLTTLCAVVVREVGTSQWNKLTIPEWPTAGSWTFTDSGAISLDAYCGKNIEIGFIYASDSTGADTWEIRNFIVTAQ